MGGYVDTVWLISLGLNDHILTQLEKENTKSYSFHLKMCILRS